MDNRKKIKSYYDWVDLRKAKYNYIEYKGYNETEVDNIQRKIVDTDGKSVVLLVAITVDSTYTRKMSFLKVIKKELEIELMGEVVCEQQCKKKFSTVRVGAVRLFGNQMSEIVNVLYKLEHGAFVVCVENDKMQILAKTLIELFNEGILTPKCYAECCNVTINHNASFFNMIRGNDGDAILLFVPISEN